MTEIPQDSMPDRIAKLVPVDQAEAVTGQALPDLLADQGVELLTRRFADSRVEDTLRVPVRLIADE